jgi:hypothetical protein
MRTSGVWLLDFDRCLPFPHDDQGIKQLKNAFFFNEPYYPRPASDWEKDKMLWGEFRATYLWASERLDQVELPSRLIEAVEAEARWRASLDIEWN